MATKTLLAAYRFDDLAELRESVDRLCEQYCSREKPAYTFLVEQGPTLLKVAEETLTDGSTVYNISFARMTKEQLKREAM